MIRQLYASLITLTALLLAAPASAQQIDGALRLHLEVGVLGFETVSAKADGADNSSTTSTLLFGPGTQSLGFGVGFGISNNLVIGGNAELQLRSVSPEDGDSSTEIDVGLSPYIELLFGDGTTRPFIGGGLSFQLGSGDNTSFQMFGLFAMGGIHLFMTDSYSLDLSGRLFVQAGSRTFEVAGMDIDTSLTRIGLLALVGVSGWSL